MSRKSDTRVPLTILALAEAVFFAGLWLWNAYVAGYMTIILPGVLFFVLLLSLVAEWIEPARLPQWYFKVMVISILVPILTGITICLIEGGRLDWLQGLPK